ncbi:MAG: flagellar biosynthetic protein FliR [Pseudomonadota bacterium]
METVTVLMPRFDLFVFVFLRMGAMFTGLPVFGSRNIPIIFRLGLAFATAFLLLPLLSGVSVPPVGRPLALALAAGAEILIGMVIGLTVRLLFSGIQLAGQMAGYQMGLALANVVDPNTSDQVPILGQLYNLIATLLFLVMNAHHWCLKAMVESFYRIPIGGMSVSPQLIHDLMGLGGQMFVVAVKVGAPVIIALLLVSVALGLVARTVPQMNVFIVAMPLNIMVGLVFVGITLPHFINYLEGLFTELPKILLRLITLMGA